MKNIKSSVVFFIMFFTALWVTNLVAEDVLMMATTTSTNDTGLLDYLAPYLKTDTGIDLRWVAVGTGKALAHGRNCDVDVLFVHDPESEQKFMSEGCGINRTQAMYNDFIIIGPKEDPAGIKGKSISNAMKKIASRKALFTSRADKSGTHMKELSLWKDAEIIPPEKKSWYVQTGQGMMNTINIAAERAGYTLTDRGTYIKYEFNFKGNPPLVILVEGDRSLKNQYSVITINPEKCKNVKVDLAKKFTQWIVSGKGQKLLGDYSMMGKKLFIPNANEK